MAAIYVTGFSCFGSVACNPTEEIVQEITKDLEIQQGSFKILGTKCLQVDAILVQQWIRNELYPSLEKLQNESSTNLELPIVVVHLGVDEKSENIRLESGACNEATFRIPDQSGWQPDGVAIDNTRQCTFTRKTKLPIRKLAEHLSKFKVYVSQDAGHYVCNYSYFVSLEEAARREQMFSLFVHVPPFSKVSKETQMDCLNALFQQLGVSLREGWLQDGENEGSGGGGSEEVNEIQKGKKSLRKLCVLM